MAAANQGISTLFDIPAIAEVAAIGTSTVSYEKATIHLQSIDKGGNPFPETLRREEQIINPEGAKMELLQWLKNYN